MTCSPPGSSVHGIFQTRILEQVATLAPDKKESILLEVLLHPPPCGPALESLSGPQGSSQQLQVCSIPSTLRETRFGVAISKCSRLIRNSLSQKKKKKALASWSNNHSRKYPNIWSHCQRAPWGPLSLPLRVVCEQTTSCWAGLCTLRHLCYSSTDTFLDLERIILSEVWQTEKDKYHMISLIRGI